MSARDLRVRDIPSGAREALAEAVASARKELARADALLAGAGEALRLGSGSAVGLGRDLNDASEALLSMSELLDGATDMRVRKDN